jgi:hypothetical protein
MNASSMSGDDVIEAVDKGHITWINVWWAPDDVRQAAIDRLMRVTSGPTGAEILGAVTLVGLEWLYWRRPLK